MRCDICGSRKDVRKWWGILNGRYYRECRQCFLEAVKLYNPDATPEDIEAEWNRRNKTSKLRASYEQVKRSLRNENDF